MMATSLKSKRRAQPEIVLATGERYAALYIRVSTGKQRENWSVQDQRSLAKLGEERGLPVVIYDEQGVSGETIEDRPTMQRLLSDVEAGKVGAVIAVDWNRLSRDEDLLDGLRIKKACKDNDVLVITPGRLYDFSTESDGFLAQLEMMFAASQKAKSAKAMVRGQYAKARAGGWTGGVPPFGYRIVFDQPHQDGRPRGRLEIASEEADVVRVMFDLYANGRTNEQGGWQPMSLGKVARWMNEHGYRLTVRKSQAGRRDLSYTAGEARQIQTSDVLRIITHRVYIGFFEWGAEGVSKWVRGEGAVEHHQQALQIIDLALWQRAQAVRQERAAGPRRIACSVRPLVGLLRCSLCGGTMICPGADRNSGRNVYFSYQCAARQHQGRTACQGTTVSERVVRKVVEALLLDHLEALHLRRYLDQAAEEEARQSEGEIAQGVMVELQHTEEKLQRLVQAVAEGVFSPSEARNVKLDLLEKKERLEARLSKLQKRAGVRNELLDAITYVEGNLPTLLAELDGPRFRSLARLVFAHIVATTEGSGPVRHGHIQHFETTEEYKELLSTYGGSASAKRIVDYRAANGPLRSIDDVRKAGVTATLANRAAAYLSFE